MKSFRPTGTAPSNARMAAAWRITPALSSAAPRPYRRPSRSVASNGAESQSSAGPGGCTSWCAYSSTVGAPAGPSTSPYTAGCAPLDLEEANPGHSGVAQEIGDGFGGTPYLCGVEIGSGDRWDPNQILEFFARSGKVGIDGGCEIFVHGLGRLAAGPGVSTLSSRCASLRLTSNDSRSRKSAS